jgi:hypothetical protein
MAPIGQAFGHDTGGSYGACRHKNRKIVAFLENAPDKFQKREAFADAGRMKPDEIAAGTVDLLASPRPFRDAVGVFLAGPSAAPAASDWRRRAHHARTRPGRGRVPKSFPLLSLSHATRSRGGSPRTSQRAAYGSACRGQAEWARPGKGNRTDAKQALALCHWCVSRGGFRRDLMKRCIDDVPCHPDRPWGPAAGFGNGERVGQCPGGRGPCRLPGDLRPQSVT